MRFLSKEWRDKVIWESKEVQASAVIEVRRPLASKE